MSERPFKVPLRLNGKPLKIQTPEVYDAGVRTLPGRGHTVQIAVTKELREVLNELESRVKELIPPNEIYKPLYPGSEMCLSLSHFARFYYYDENFIRSVMPVGTPLTKFGDGHYVFELHAPHLYFGMHKNGETCSINLNVAAINWKPTVRTERDSIEALTPGVSPFQMKTHGSHHFRGYVTDGERILFGVPDGDKRPVSYGPQSSKGIKHKRSVPVGPPHEDSA